MPDLVAQILVATVLVAAGAFVLGVAVALGRRHGAAWVLVPIAIAPTFLLTLLYLPTTAPIIVAIFVASTIASGSRRVYRALPSLVATAFASCTILIAALHVRDVTGGHTGWNIDDVVLAAVLLVGAFFITLGVVEWGRRCARRVVWRGRY